MDSPIRLRYSGGPPLGRVGPAGGMTENAGLIRTLSLFLSRELWKATALSLVAFTLVMTVFAIIEPLHKEGLAAGQLASLLSFTLPVMLSLTLPIAALFAATIVYGRFSQDNELTACRASGVSTLRLLKPAMVLGGVVTVVSLFLSNFVTPRMIALAEHSVKSNVVQIIRQKFRSESYVNYGRYFVHADHVEDISASHDVLELRGVVAVDARERRSQQYLSAGTAYVEFTEDQGEIWATISLISPTATPAGGRDIVEVASMTLPPLRVPDWSAREEASWYDWGQLRQTLEEPRKNPAISKALTKIKRRICHDMQADEIIREINRGQPYENLTREGEVYSIRAARARKGEDETVELFSSADGGQRVEVKVLRDGVTTKTVTAEAGLVEMNWSTVKRISQASIELRDGVIIGPADGAHPTQRRTRWEIGQLGLPTAITDKAEKISLEDVYLNPKSLTTNGPILYKIEDLRKNAIPDVIRRVEAEMHSRIAYGVSCFLMVTMGAALGLMFRGGQLISAFALSVIPAAVVIVMMLMGKQLARNQGVPEFYGLASIWSGVVALLIADACVLLHLGRK